MNPIVVGIVSAIVYILMEMGLHGGLLASAYQATSHLWRPEAEMKNLFPLMMLGQVFFGFFFGLTYTKGYESGKGTVSQGFRYGLLMALMLGPMSGLVWYVILSIPQSMAWSWAIGCSVQMIILGLIVGALYKK